MIFCTYTQKDLDKNEVSAEDIFQTKKRFVAKLDLSYSLYKSIEKAISDFFINRGKDI